MSLTVAALQYCASDDAAATLAHIEPLISKAAKTCKADMSSRGRQFSGGKPQPVAGACRMGR
jgi:ABC-type protease/lipase transport system fused ATPase/permease subunit